MDQSKRSCKNQAVLFARSQGVGSHTRQRWIATHWYSFFSCDSWTFNLLGISVEIWKSPCSPTHYIGFRNQNSKALPPNSPRWQNNNLIRLLCRFSSLFLLTFADSFSSTDHTRLTWYYSFKSTGSHVSAASTNFDQMKKNHGVLGIIGWGLILPIGAIVPRYFKHKDPLWYYLHSVLQFIGFAIGLATVILGQRLYDLIHADFPSHRGIGIFILVLSILQVRPSIDTNYIILLVNISSCTHANFMQPFYVK